MLGIRPVSHTEGGPSLGIGRRAFAGNSASIFVDLELDVFQELHEELLITILLLCNLFKHLQVFLDQVPFNDAQDLVLLENLA